MAESIREQDAEIVFSNIPSNAGQANLLVNRAGQLTGQLFEADLHNVLETSLDPDRAASGTRFVILLMDSSAQRNMGDALLLSGRFSGNSAVSVYVFTSAPESEALIDNLNIRNYSRHLHPMKLRRADLLQTEIGRDLAAHSPFDLAVTIHSEKWINVVLLGLHRYSMALLRTLLWFCQMDGYYLRADVFDEDAAVKDRFDALCPGVAERGSRPRMGEDYYDLHFHGGICLSGNRLFDLLKELPDCSWAVADLGSDDADIALAMKLRAFYTALAIEDGRFVSHLADARQKPRIQAVVSDDARAALIDPGSFKNFRGQYYQIEPAGQNRCVYSIDRLLDDPLEKQALAMHSRLQEPETFEMYEYFRRSSMASALHLPYRQALVASEAVRSVTEHRRWCAYMRSAEGYRYGTARDDLAKLHPSLSPYADLSRAEQEKDRRMNPASAAPAPEDKACPGTSAPKT